MKNDCSDSTDVIGSLINIYNNLNTFGKKLLLYKLIMSVVFLYFISLSLK